MARSKIIDISWADRKLSKHCSSDGRGQRRWGADHWKLLRRRLAALKGAPTLQDMSGVPGGCHQLHADRRQQFAIDLWGSYRLIFVADHDPVPVLTDGGIDRSKVTRIQILDVVDYHGR